MKKKFLTNALFLLFILFFLFDGLAGLLRESSGREVMRLLGYPEYLLSILGTAKIIGTLCLVQNRSAVLKEWAFAGFTINFIGAAASWAFIGEPIGLLLPIVMTGLLLFLRSQWLRQAKQNTLHHVRAFTLV